MAEHLTSEARVHRGGWPRAPLDDLAALQAFLLERVEFELNSGCWLWFRAHSKGYGHIKINGEPFLAHRLSWRAFNGEEPAEWWVLHRCDTPACINPDHLFLGTATDNMQDMHSKGRAVMPRGYGRVSSEKAEAIRRALQQGRSIRQTARDFGVSGPTVRYHREYAA